MIKNLPKDFRITSTMEEYEQYLNLRERRLYITTEIKDSDSESDGLYKSKMMQIVDDIMDYNREDTESHIPPTERTPIRLYINSPGGDVHEGFSLVSTIELSKTPIYTINIGQWSSMAFMIGITGHRRFSLPKMMFLMHDGNNGTYDSGSKAQDRMDFYKRFDSEVVKNHILKHSKMKADEYDRRVREEVYMLPEDALGYGFIDEIVTDINTIL